MKTQSKKSYIRLAILAMFLCLSFLAAYTYAWFFDTDSVTGTLTFGKIDMTATGTLAGASVLPGDLMFNGDSAADLVVEKATGSEDFYLVVKVTVNDFTYKGSDFPANAKENENDSSTDTFTAAAAASAITTKYKGTLDAELKLGTGGTGFQQNGITSIYVYTGSGTTPTIVSTPVPVTVVDVSALKVPDGMTQFFVYVDNKPVPVQDLFGFTVTFDLVAVQGRNIATGTPTLEQVVTASGLS